jgi:hypothetical protein
MRLLSVAALGCVWMLLCPPPAAADSILYDTITLTSVLYDPAYDPALFGPQEYTFTDIDQTRKDAGVFSDWMYGIDSGTYIEFIPGTEQSNGDYDNIFAVGLSGNDCCFDYPAGSTITLTMQLPSSQVFNTSYFALISAIAGVEDPVVNGGTFSFEITDLDTLSNNGIPEGGEDEFVFDVEPAPPGAPEPATFTLSVLALAALLFAKRQ